MASGTCHGGEGGEGGEIHGRGSRYLYRAVVSVRRQRLMDLRTVTHLILCQLSHLGLVLMFTRGWLIE